MLGGGGGEPVHGLIPVGRSQPGPDRKTRILKAFRTGGFDRKSFSARPLLLALWYPMNIELGY
jgi:hypothetical protein